MSWCWKINGLTAEKDICNQKFLMFSVRFITLFLFSEKVMVFCIVFVYNFDYDVKEWLKICYMLSYEADLPKAYQSVFHSYTVKPAYNGHLSSQTSGPMVATAGSRTAVWGPTVVVVGARAFAYWEAETGEMWPLYAGNHFTGVYIERVKGRCVCWVTAIGKLAARAGLSDACTTMPFVAFSSITITNNKDPCFRMILRGP